MKVITYAHMPNMLDGTIHPARRVKFSQPISALRECVQEDRDQRPTCEICGKRVPRRRDWWLDVYDSPWDDTPRQVDFCSDVHQGEWEGEGYFSCDSCFRWVAESRGFHAYYRRMGDGYMTCLRCYEEDILAHGQPAEDYEEDAIRGGMFFNYGNPEPLAAGYQVLDHEFVKREEDAARYNKIARTYIELGWQVLTCYEQMSIMGDEGTITLMGKKKEEV